MHIPHSPSLPPIRYARTVGRWVSTFPSPPLCPRWSIHACCWCERRCPSSKENLERQGWREIQSPGRMPLGGVSKGWVTRAGISLVTKKGPGQRLPRPLQRERAQYLGTPRRGGPPPRRKTSWRCGKRRGAGGEGTEQTEAR